jgi:8-oxo-dGTP pyrophosphatase MutT (NUDIX family)
MWVKELLASKFVKSLPGRTIQYQMAPLQRYSIQDPPKQALKAGVALVVKPSDQGLGSLLYIQRSKHEKDVHSGQISFPGGKFEGGKDVDTFHCALRELREEIGLQLTTQDHMGSLSELYIPISNFLVYPHVLYQGTKCEDLSLDPNEVEELIEIPIAHLLDSNNRRPANISTPNNVLLKEVPAYHYKGKVIWGATAMMTCEFLHMIR